MARLPHGDAALIDFRKLTDYVLNPQHRLGAHKARVFRAALGLTADNAGELDVALRRAAAQGEAILDREDAYGAHYHIDFSMAYDGRESVVRSLWIIRPDEDAPRLVSAFVT
jgi:hypothetical protein